MENSRPVGPLQPLLQLVESSHKHVVHKRLKGASMRLAERHVAPLLALRNLIANDRWARAGNNWSAIANNSAGHRDVGRNRSPYHPLLRWTQLRWPQSSLAHLRRHQMALFQIRPGVARSCLLVPDGFSQFTKL